MLKMFFAAFTSLSCEALHASHFQTRFFSCKSCLICPHLEHILLLGSNLPMNSRFLPLHSDLYLSMFTNSLQVENEDGPFPIHPSTMAARLDCLQRNIEVRIQQQQARSL